MLDVLRREPFDKDAFRAAMATTLATRRNFDETIENILVDATSQMSLPHGVSSQAGSRLNICLVRNLTLR
jgi:hypothetical protein